MNFNMFLPGLEDVLVTKMEQIEDRVAFHVEMELTPHSSHHVWRSQIRFMTIGFKRLNILKYLNVFRLSFIGNVVMFLVAGRNSLRRILLFKGTNDFQVNGIVRLIVDLIKVIESTYNPS